MDNLESFFIRGYVHSKLDLPVDEFTKWNFVDCKRPEGDWTDPAAEDTLASLHQHLADNYISKIFDNYEMKDYAMWSGVDDGSSVWHNDYEDRGKFNSNILVYLDDNTEENGNNIQVRDGNTEWTIYPRRGDFVWLNQKKCFQHRAQHKSGVRRVLSFEYLIPALF